MFITYNFSWLTFQKSALFPSKIDVWTWFVCSLVPWLFLSFAFTMIHRSVSPAKNGERMGGFITWGDGMGLGGEEVVVVVKARLWALGSGLLDWTMDCKVHFLKYSYQSQLLDWTMDCKVHFFTKYSYQSQLCKNSLYLIWCRYVVEMWRYHWPL